MLIKWQKSLSIGVPEIDTEHKYLVALINNIHDDFCSKKIDRNIADAFVHLTKYFTKHFRNEEAMMYAGNYPLLKEHKRQHEDLTDELSDLTEKFIAGEDHISEETMDFLKKLLFDHVISEDKKICLFFDEKGAPCNWNYTPVYSEASESYFKKCTCCDNQWKTFDDLARDQDKTEPLCMADEYNHLFNLILFNCACGTTLAMPLTDFIGNCGKPFNFEERNVDQEKADYCLRKEKSEPCLSRCACSFTEIILTALRQSIE
jgi:hemerythrin-like metal-binding protein